MSFVLDPRLARDSHAVGELRLSQLRLMDDARFTWLILVPRIAGARELVDLDATDRSQLLEEITLIGRALEVLVCPDKLNIAAIGNVVAQLHVHLIARFESDALWPDPVWGRGERVVLTNDAREQQLARLREALKAELS